MDSSGLPWYAGFFQSLANEFWRRVATPELTVAEVEFLVPALALKPGARVLDVPCGTGRHAAALARLGCRVVGVDYSMEALAEAAKSSEVSVVRADMAALPLRRQPLLFDAAFCFGNSFGYLNPAGTTEFFESLGALLRTGARFALETGMAAESLLPALERRWWFQSGDLRVLLEHEYQPAEGLLETRFTFLPGNGAPTEQRLARHWIFTVREIRALLESAGLQTEGCYANLSRDPYCVGASRLILVARRGAR